MTNEVRHNIFLALLGALLAAVSMYDTNRDLTQQAGRLLGLAGLCIGWLIVLALVHFGVLSVGEGLLETVWVCGGAIAGALLHSWRTAVVRVETDR